MLFQVISTPRAEQPSKARGNQRGWWPWLHALEAQGIVKSCYVRCGRGAIVVFDVDSNETLHRLVNEWQELVPAEFMIFPLVPAAYQEKLSQSGNPLKRRVGKKK
jgi:hypothetical protein